MIINFKGCNIVLNTDFLRITENPKQHRYPKTGDKIYLEGHPIIEDGEYIVEIVTEFEPGYHKDIDGRDIRISLFGYGKDWNGNNIVKYML